MAIRRRGTYQRDPDAPQRLDADDADLAGMENQIVSQSKPGRGSGGQATQRVSSGRARSMFNVEAGPAEQAYMDELGRPDPQFQRLPQATGKKRVFGKILSQFRGTQAIGEEMVYGDERRHAQDYGTAVAERGRKLANLGAGANLEANRRTAGNTAQYRTADLNLKFDRNQRERQLLPGRQRVLETAADRNVAMGQAQKALGQQRANASNSPFRVLPPFAGTYDQRSGKPGMQPDTAGYIRSRAQAARSGGRGNEVQLAAIERDKQSRLTAQARQFDKEVSQAEEENRGFSPTLEDGSPNPMYTFEARMREINQRNEARKQQIQNSYEEQLKRLGQNVEHYDYSGGGEEPGGPQSEDLGAAVDLQDERDQMETGEDPADPIEGDDELVTIETPDGRQGTIPASRLQEAIQQGAKLVNRGY